MIKMRKLLVVIAGLSLVACARSFEEASLMTVEQPETQVWGENIPEENLSPGVMNVLVSEEFAAELEAASDEEGHVRISGLKSVSAKPFTSMRRLFPPAGKFEARTRAEGMHLWYRVTYDEGMAVTKAAGELKSLPGIKKIEYVPKVGLVGNPTVTSVDDEPRAGTAAATPSASLPFDDPGLSRQWHYYNDGSASSAVSGCDINVVPVWNNYTTGDKDVIVCVVDQGVDYTHEDLADNMWHNPDQKGENIYGYNFASDTYNIHPGDHGTHVAGTIAAVNNNGKGVSGIAGGNSKKKIAGVKIMSCQMFDGSRSGSGEQGIKWGADHGAVISQNSWGYIGIDYTPETLKKAVDYFIKYAGVDENGNQTGPMKGGIVIFAAGNDNQDFSGNEYGPIFNVASVGADYRRAYYSNFGDWIDVAAPGGDVKKGNQVYSTLPGNKYGNMQGTSMACPHVSGVAALIVSAKKGQGFTATALEKMLRDNATDIASFNLNHGMGAGLVNAYKSIAGSGGKAPETPTALKASAVSNNVTVSVKVPKDADDKVPQNIYFYYSEQDFTKVDGLSFANFYTEGLKAGDVLEGVIQGMDFDKSYYMVAVACDLAGNKSGMSNKVRFNTTSNTKPEIKVLSGLTASIKPHESYLFNFGVSDPDGHFVHSTISIEENPGFILDTVDFAKPSVRAYGPELESGHYDLYLVSRDAYGASDSVKMDITVLENHAPVVKKPMENLIYKSKAAVTTQVKASEYFYDEDGEDLAYQIEIDNPAVFNLAEAKGVFSFTPMSYGYCNVTVTATDVRKETLSQSFRVLVRDGDSAVDVYPNPVTDYLYVRTSDEANASVQVINTVGAVVKDSDIRISPFDPAKVDMRDLPAGMYTVSVSYDGQTITKKVAKI